MRMLVQKSCLWWSPPVRVPSAFWLPLPHPPLSCTTRLYVSKCAHIYNTVPTFRKDLRFSSCLCVRGSNSGALIVRSPLHGRCSHHCTVALNEPAFSCVVGVNGFGATSWVTDSFLTCLRPPSTSLHLHINAHCQFP